MRNIELFNLDLSLSLNLYAIMVRNLFHFFVVVLTKYQHHCFTQCLLWLTHVVISFFTLSCTSNLPPGIPFPLHEVHPLKFSLIKLFLHSHSHLDFHFWVFLNFLLADQNIVEGCSYLILYFWLLSAGGLPVTGLLCCWRWQRLRVAAELPC